MKIFCKIITSEFAEQVLGLQSKSRWDNTTRTVSLFFDNTKILLRICYNISFPKRLTPFESIKQTKERKKERTSNEMAYQLKSVRYLVCSFHVKDLEYESIQWF
jgi:hypothetical protein